MSDRYVIACSTAGTFPDRALFAAFREAGIEAMEISVKSEAYAQLDYESLAALSKEYGVALWSYHLPFMPFETLDISNPALAADSVAYLSSLIRKATAIGIPYIVIHASGEPIAEEDRPVRMACAKKSLAVLAELACAHGAVLAVEDLPRTCLGRNSEDILDLLSVHPSLRVCFDTNHLLGEDPVHFIRRLGNRIVTTHVSDYDFQNERHWLPGEGKLDFSAILSALSEVGYRGPWLYELGLTAPASIQRKRDLSYRDIVENAMALFAGEAPRVLGVPVPGLGSWK